MRSEQQANRAIERYGDTVQRICRLHLKNAADTEDIFQTVFLKYVLSREEFESEEHERAWIIRVAINACKDHLRHLLRGRTIPLEEAGEMAAPVPEDHSEVLQAVQSLPKKYRDVVYLFYYEQYTAVEIGKILSKPPNTIYTRLARAKELLKQQLGGDVLEESHL